MKKPESAQEMAEYDERMAAEDSVALRAAGSVDLIAEALWRIAVRTPDDSAWTDLVDRTKDGYRADARAAVEAVIAFRVLTPERKASYRVFGFDPTRPAEADERHNLNGV